MDLASFYHRFGPSARSVYVNASSIASYYANIREKLAQLTYNSLDLVVRQASGLNLSHQISHQITLISPGAERHEFEVTIATRFLYELLRDALSDRTLETAARLYNMFIRTRYTRSSAGYMLDDGIHNVFCKGGEWKIVRMVKHRPGPKYTHWKNPNPTTDTAVVEYLRVGHLGHPVVISPQPLPKDTTYEHLPYHEYLQLSNFSLADGYYRPASGSEETLDAFIYDASNKTATIFQATVSKKHSVKEGGIEWLQGLGVEIFRFVAVTPPDTPMDLPFPNKWRTSVEPLVPEKYILALDSLPAS